LGIAATLAITVEPIEKLFSDKIVWAQRTMYLTVVKAVRGILMRECTNLYKSMKIGTLVIFDMLCPNLPGAKANSQWCCHIRQFKMAAA